jgi:cytochrome P450
MTDEEIVDNLLTFIAAGHETTALALAWTFGLLAAHPEHAARMVAEIDEVSGGGPIEASHVERLAFTRQVVSEAMRLYPPAPMIVRTVEREIEVGGAALPAGSVVFAPIHAVHRHRTLWPRPDAFDPGRFAPEAVKARHRLAYMPFGVGPRVCIGATFAITEAVAILAVVAKALRLERVDPELPEPVMRVTLRPSRPLRMRVAPR